jgi:serine/threonine-protein kinase
VISSAGIKSVQDVLATMREQELRGQEASEHELPYVAPEVLMGAAPDPRADIFTIGVLAYQLVTGDVPFKAASIPELIGRMLQTRPAPPASIPDLARDAIVTALDSAPANRFESADAFARALA